MPIDITPRRPYLVFVRAGCDSQHRRLLQENPERNWDCCINWYMDASDEGLAEHYYGSAADPSLHKLQGFLQLWQVQPQPWPYRYTLLLDDDVYLAPGELSRFFAICDHFKTYVSQPAQEWFTHTTLNLLVRNPACVMRRVSFVEGMAPCFSTNALTALVHTFNWTESVWGIDWSWGALLEGHRPMSVVDDVSMVHTRTGDGRPTRFYRTLKARGIDPAADLKSIQETFPSYRGPRVLKTGHVYRTDLPLAVLAPIYMQFFERMKFIVRTRKQFMRQWRSMRARIEDYAKPKK